MAVSVFRWPVRVRARCHELSAGGARLFVLTVLAVAAFVLPGGEAAAQIRPAFTKNVDEPGRQPYNLSVEFSQFGCQSNCSNFVSFGGQVRLFDAPAVRAGKRLVVQWISADLPSNNEFNSISFQLLPILSNQRANWQYHGLFFATSPAGEIRGASSGGFFTREAGEQPHIRVRMRDPNNFFASITIGGCLIAQNN